MGQTQPRIKMALRKKLVEVFQVKKTDGSLWLNLLLFITLGIIFWPFTQWLAQSAQDQSRLSNALIILALAILCLIRFNRIKVQDPLSLNKSARNGLLLAYFSLFIGFLLNYFTKQTVPSSLLLGLSTIIAFCATTYAFILFLLGKKFRRIALTACITFCLFISISTLMGSVDWPLRTLAGKWSGYLLNLIGKSIELGISENGTSTPQLILTVDGSSFHVASECNGFGVILSCLLIALLLSLYNQLRPGFLLINLTAGLFLGFAFNIIRITCIVLTAPFIISHYDLMHEIIGSITFWSALVLAWFLFNGPTKDVQKTSLPQQNPNEQTYP
jgi:exosortase/archaeosortase family protein